MSTTAPPASSAPPPAGAPAPSSPSDWRTLATHSVAGPLAALLLAGLFFSFQSEQFLSGGNLSLVMQQVMVVGTLALGQTLVILIAGIDLSCGMIMAFGSIVMAKLAVDSGLPPLPAILAGLAVCALLGLANGALVTFVGLPPFIVTLGMLNVAFALTHIVSDDQTVTALPSELTALGETFPLGRTDVTYGSVLTLVLFAVFAYLLGWTAWGRHTYALGNSPEVARLTGIRVDRLRLGIFTVAGFVYGIAALLLISRTGVGDPKAGTDDNLNSITAVVLGGTSLFGGRGLVVGTLIGALIVGVFRNGLQLMGVGSIYQTLITGVLVILAVTVDQVSRRKASR
ncbi:ABC transporter permease [Streptomyces sp. NPDC058417]|uniref:ABC transporter permease n=1 Tax=unclassified Streptomyces TaxID=2593676 RepID=UPI00365CDC6B